MRRPRKARAPSSSIRFGTPDALTWGGTGLGTQAPENLRELATDVRGGAIPRCGHWVPEEQPEELARALSGFRLG